MIDVRLLRTDLDATLVAMARRGRPELLDQLRDAAKLDGRLRDITAERDAAREQVNELSKQVGVRRRAGDVAGADELAAQSRELGEQERQLADEHTVVAAELRDVLLAIPNVPHPAAPDGVSEEDNPVVRGPFNLPADFAEHRRVPHWETAAALGILDNERATKISGSMFTMTRGLGATMGRALCQLALDRNADAFEEIRPPSLVTSATLTASGQLPKFADDAFAIERDDLWAIPTAEVPLTSIYRDEILDEADLPKRLMAYTPCYRREAGSAGKDTRGMLRAHEFDKVEILAVATPEQGSELLDELLARAEGLIAALGLPYRTSEICTGDFGQSHYRTLDVEVYSPGTDTWLEVSSVSWFSDYQGRRANIRFRRRGQKGTEIAHTLNGSAVAVPRVWAAILEHYRQPDGSVVIPEALRPYMRGAERIDPPS
ncbi:MAG TPA: serine--tRNA ligase [Desertimonas sp.]|nr:serine--tRNA ligase [Desertimonas sp.]HET9667122.1 serine--tRNA ligase [Desertimonas sp.]